jgi:hypothetical protein
MWHKEMRLFYGYHGFSVGVSRYRRFRGIRGSGEGDPGQFGSLAREAGGGRIA